MRKTVPISLILKLAKQYNEEPEEVIEEIIKAYKSGIQNKYALVINATEFKYLKKLLEANKAKNRQKKEPATFVETIKVELKKDDFGFIDEFREESANEFIRDLEETIPRSNEKKLTAEEKRFLKFAFMHTDGFNSLMELEQDVFLAKSNGKPLAYPKIKKEETEDYSKLLGIIESLNKFKTRINIPTEGKAIETYFRKKLGGKTLEEILENYEGDREEVLIIMARGEKLGVKIKKEHTEKEKQNNMPEQK